MTPKFLVIHHSAVANRLNPDQFRAIDTYHRNKGWGGCGYHFVIVANGKVYAGRPENAVGAHCKEQGMNLKSLGICLTGDFDHDKPTDQQIFALRDLLKKLTKKYGISKNNIMFHRDYAPKTCPGKNMNRDVVRNLVTLK